MMYHKIQKKMKVGMMKIISKHDRGTEYDVVELDNGSHLILDDEGNYQSGDLIIGVVHDYIPIINLQLKSVQHEIDNLKMDYHSTTTYTEEEYNDKLKQLKNEQKRILRGYHG